MVISNLPWGPQIHINQQQHEHLRIHVFSKSFFNRETSGKHVHVMNTPLNPTFIQLNWDLRGVYLFFLFLLQNIDCGYSLEPPRRGGSNVYPQSMF